MLIPRTARSTKDYEFLATTLRSIGDAVLTTDSEANITFMNPMAELLTGRSIDEAEGKKAYEVLELRNEETDEKVKCPVMRVLENDEPTGYLNHTVIYSKDGSSRVVSYNATPLRGEDGRLEGVVVVFHGALSRDELRKSEERFRLISRATNDTVWDLDLSTRALWINDAITTVFGYKANQVEGSLDWWLSRVHPDDRGRVEQLYATAEVESRFFQQEYRFQDHSGYYNAVLERGYVLRNAEGKAMRMVAAVMDITGRREAQEELMRINAELEQEVDRRTLALRQANRELESFSYSVSHDLRVPLRNIIISSQMLEIEKADVLDDETKRVLSGMVDSANRMSDLINDLLEYSRLSRSRMKVVPVDMSAIAKSVVERLQTQSKCTAEFVVHEGMHAQGDPGLLHVLYENLISNACKFSSAAADARVEVGSFQRRDEMVYFVMDNGVGFDIRHAAKLFEPFERFHSTEEYPGTGLGLANVRRVVTRHGGRIWAESAPGEGATFYFTLG